MSIVSKSGVDTLVPPRAILALYRRYLKSAMACSNLTIRNILIKQIRSSFRVHAGIKNPRTQRELIQQSHSDLLILEDPVHNRQIVLTSGGLTLHDWMRFSPNHGREVPGDKSKAQELIIVLGFALVIHAALTALRPSENQEEIERTVDLMAARLEAPDGDLSKLEDHRREAGIRLLDSLDRQKDLEMRLVSSLSGAPGYEKTVLGPRFAA